MAWGVTCDLVVLLLLLFLLNKDDAKARSTMAICSGRKKTDLREEAWLSAPAAVLLLVAFVVGGLVPSTTTVLAIMGVIGCENWC